jgi:hypothetical protein
VRLAWPAAIQPANVTTTAYVLEKRVGDAGQWVAFPDLPTTQLDYTDLNLPPNQVYYYRLKARLRLNDGTTGESAYAANNTQAQPCIAVVIGNAPANLAATPQ